MDASTVTSPAETEVAKPATTMSLSLSLSSSSSLSVAATTTTTMTAAPATAAGGEVDLSKEAMDSAAAAAAAAAAQSLRTTNDQQQQQQQQQQQPQQQKQPLMLKTTKEKATHKRKKTENNAQAAVPSAVLKLESTPDVSAGSLGDLRDDEDDNDDDEDRLLMQEYDPERLKAFNMFVRLFVDENLDRVAPISKQPKEKIQAILEACDRQFPEFHHRSRKRIRTYLKSCRRMRRSKGTGDGKQVRPTLPHLTSAAAETILARACENESNNAKRMRMGLEPLPATDMALSSSPSTSCPAPSAAPVLPVPPPTPLPLPAPQVPPSTTVSSLPIAAAKSSSSSSQRSKMELSPHSAAATPGVPPPTPATPPKPLELTSSSQQQQQQTGSRASPSSSAHAQSKPAAELSHCPPMRQPSPKAAHRPVDQDHVTVQSSATLRGALPPESELLLLPVPYVTNGGGGGGGGGGGVPPKSHVISPLFQNEASYLGAAGSIQQVNDQIQNGPTDLSMKKDSSKGHLNPEEVATIKQLIAGYRESAAFLCRSADELQQLIMQHN